MKQKQSSLFGGFQKLAGHDLNPEVLRKIIKDTALILATKEQEKGNEQTRIDN